MRIKERQFPYCEHCKAEYVDLEQHKCLKCGSVCPFTLCNCYWDEKNDRSENEEENK